MEILNQRTFLRRMGMALLVLAFAAQGLWAQSRPYTSYTAIRGTDGFSNNEGYAKLVDNKTSTKWCCRCSDSCYVDFMSADSIVPVGYVLTTGNDNREYWGRNPKNWVIKAKAGENDGWTTLIAVNNDSVLQDEDYQTYQFGISNQKSFRYFRFVASGVTTADSVFQMSELKFLIPMTADYRANLSNAVVDSLAPIYYSTGSPVVLNYAVKSADGTLLTKNTHYTAAVKNSSGEIVETIVKAGLYTLTITAKEGGGYTDSLSLPFEVSRIPVGLLVDEYYEPDDVEHYYACIPTEGADSLVFTSDCSVNRFTVYSDNKRTSNGALTMTAPEGYVFMVANTANFIKAPEFRQASSPVSASKNTLLDKLGYLTIYDGADTLCTSLGKGRYYLSDRMPYICSTGRSMTLAFHSDTVSRYRGLELTVMLVDASKYYKVEVDRYMEYGRIIADKDSAKVNEVVTFSVVPDEGYRFAGFDWWDSYVMMLNDSTFIMPAKDIHIGADFIEAELVTYLDKDSVAHSVMATPLTSANFYLLRDYGGFFIINDSLNINRGAYCDNGFSLILADSACLNLGGYYLYSEGDVCIYSQSHGKSTGTILIKSDDDYGLYARNITFSGANINIESTGQGGHYSAPQFAKAKIRAEGYDAIKAEGNVVIKGGNIKAVSTYGYGISAGDSIVIGYSAPSDTILVSSFSPESVVRIADGQTFLVVADTPFEISGIVGDVSSLAGKVLTPMLNPTAVTLTNDTKAKTYGAYYTIDGVRLVGKPAAKGVYIQDRRKVVVR
ncbi:MAG: hypothetical protein IKR18_09520 [Bacteroidaceae bacterium]|nr:hypothetical protein [Bacteroidaceae bacterium]